MSEREREGGREGERESGGTMLIDPDRDGTVFIGLRARVRARASEPGLWCELC